MNIPASISFKFTPSALRDHVYTDFFEKQRIGDFCEEDHRYYYEELEIYLMLNKFFEFFIDFCLRDAHITDPDYIENYIALQRTRMVEHLKFIKMAELISNQDGSIKFLVNFKPDTGSTSSHMHDLAEQLMQILMLTRDLQPTVTIQNGPYVIKLEAKNYRTEYRLSAINRSNNFSYYVTKLD